MAIKATNPPTSPIEQHIARRAQRVYRKHGNMAVLKIIAMYSLWPHHRDIKEAKDDDDAYDDYNTSMLSVTTTKLPKMRPEWRELR